MAKTWVLDTETKGTGAQVVPLEKAVRKPPADQREARRRRPKGAPAKPSPRRKPRPQAETSAGPLPPGHVRKKATGELGVVQAVDPKAGTASVRWLKRGATSTVPLSAISRR
jgi:hypothetical protein